MGISTLSNPYICYLGNHLSVTLHSLIFFGPPLRSHPPGIFGSTLRKDFFGGLWRMIEPKAVETCPN
jgi:hypothetical protein